MNIVFGAHFPTTLYDHTFFIIVFALLLGITSLLMGAVFSATEICFYRVSKLRLKLDALAGDKIAKQLFWLTNNPGLFIATIIVGNNVTTYGVSMAIVIFIATVLPNANGITTEIIGTFLLTPFLFVYGEMFPKNLCLNAPYGMLRLLSPISILACWLFLPLTILLWGVNTLITFFITDNDKKVTLSMGRKDLSLFLVEGQNTGILSDTQRRLAEGIFACSDHYIKDYVVPPMDFPMITTAMTPQEVLKIAQQGNFLGLPVYESDVTESDVASSKSVLPLGLVRIIDLEIAVRHQLDSPSLQLAQLLQTELPLSSIVELSSKCTLLTGLILLLTMKNPFGYVADEHRNCLGFVHADQLCDVLLSAEPFSALNHQH